MSISKKIFAFLLTAMISLTFAFQSALATSTVPGSFTTQGERAVPIITFLGLYNAAGVKINPGGGTAIPNTRHSIRFSVTNETYSFEDLSIRVAFFQSEDGSKSDFDTARVNNFGDAFVARVNSTGTSMIYATGSSAATVSWDDNHFLPTLHKDDFLATDNSYQFEIYFNMSKVASSYDDYYIGVEVTQIANNETLTTYDREGYYVIGDFTQYTLDTTNLRLDWSLDNDEVFFDFNGSSASSRQTLSGTLFSIISNTDIFLEIYADTKWFGQDLDEPNNPDAIVEAYLVEGFPYFQQEFSIYYEGNFDGYVSGNSNSWAFITRTFESGASAPDLDLFLEVHRNNFENGIYNGAFYFDAVQQNF